MAALEKEGRWAEAVAQLSLMRAANFTLDVVCYSAAISACEQGAAWQEALELLDDMAAEGGGTLKPMDMQGQGWSATGSIRARAHSTNASAGCLVGYVSALSRSFFEDCARI
jgi:hypothetical protein